MADINGDFEFFEELGDNFIFEVFGVLVNESVVIVHHAGCGLFVPDVEHCGVDEVGFGVLGVIGDGTADGFGIGASAPEPTLAAGDTGEVAFGGDLLGDPEMPLGMARECLEVLRLEGLHEFKGNASLCTQGWREPFEV